MPTPLTRLDAGRAQPNVPDVEARPAQYSPGAAPLVQAPQFDLGTIDRATSWFGRMAHQGVSEALSGDETARRMQQAQQDKDLAAQGTADAESGAAPATGSQQFSAYANAYLSTKGPNVGNQAFVDFKNGPGAKLGPTDDPQAAIADYLKNNPFTIGNPVFDAHALSAFQRQATNWQMQTRENQVKAATADGEQQVYTNLGNQLQNGTLTTDGLQQSIANVTRLNPMAGSQAGQKVLAALLGAATTPDQIQSASSLMEAPGSFKPGVSIAQQFPQAYAEWNEKSARRVNEVNSAAGVQQFDSIADRVMTMHNTGDMSDFPNIMKDLNAARNQYGGLARAESIKSQANEVMRAAATAGAGVNGFTAGIGDPNRDPKFVSSMDKAFTKNGWDPLSPDPAVAGPAIQAINNYRQVDEATSKKFGNGIMDGTNPQRQAQTYNALSALEGNLGRQGVLSLLPESARIQYQTAANMLEGGANPQAYFQATAGANKGELKDLTPEVITGTTDPTKAKQAMTAAITGAVNTATGANGWTGANVQIGPDVLEHLTDQVKSGAVAMQGQGAYDVKQLAKDAWDRSAGNIQVVPGSDGTRVATMLNNAPKVVSDGNGGVRQPVPLGISVPNPYQPGTTTNTTDVAAADLKSLHTVFPDRVGTSGMTLSAAPGSYAQTLYQARGSWTVLNGGRPIIMQPGDTVNIGGQPVKVPVSPTALGAMIDQAAGGKSPFGLQPITSQDPRTNKPVTTYMLTYQPRFGNEPPTVAEREKNYQAPSSNLVDDLKAQPNIPGP